MQTELFRLCILVQCFLTFYYLKLQLSSNLQQDLKPNKQDFRRESTKSNIFHLFTENSFSCGNNLVWPATFLLSFPSCVSQIQSYEKIDSDKLIFLLMAVFHQTGAGISYRGK